VLLDENMPHSLRRSLAHHDVATVAYMGWSGFKNGNLLRIAEESGVEVFVTGDKALTYQQNMDGRRMAVVALSAHNWPIVKYKLAEIAGAVDRAVPGSFQLVDCGKFRRGGRSSKTG
jgi:hypothetical protein